jgi:amino acid permease
MASYPNEKIVSQYPEADEHGLSPKPSEENHVQPATELHRGLKARHITMIAIGGAIGK